MRHRVKGRKLNRSAQHRNMMMANLTSSLIIYESIETTLPKAKMLAGDFDKIVNLAKKGDDASRRRASSKLKQNEAAVEKLFEVMASKLKSRNSGYTRRYILGSRHGDNARMAKVEIIYDEVKSPKKDKTDKSKDDKK